MGRTVGEPAAKRTKLHFDSDNESDSGVKLEAAGFKINDSYAKRFEHNKKREERARLEERLGASKSNAANNNNKRKYSDEEDSEDSEDAESEDDDAALATEDVDQEIFATLEAIKKKDPRVYDANVKFYSEFDPESATTGAEKKKEKPMYLQDYQRERLLSGHAGGDDEEEHVPTYEEEQDQLRRQLVGEMHGSKKPEASSDDEGDGFMVAKKKSRHDDMPGLPKEKKQKTKITDEDIKAADKDPETYLSNFMLARAWLPGEGARFDALESDDSEDDNRADEFEHAYNMRFEDPNTANEKLLSFARDVGKYGVRREEKNSRARGREREREVREAEKREREEDKARLRKLKIEEAEEKVKRIKEAAGLRGKALNLDEWRDVLDGDFDDSKWDEVLTKRFGDDYYNADDVMGSDDEEDGGKKRKPTKPKWDDDIDIDDLVPDFDITAKPQVALSDLDDDEEEGGAPVPDSDDDEATSAKKKKTKKDREKEKADAKRAARIEKKKIEDLVDSNLAVHDPTLTSAASSRAPVVGFRYRETSPTNFGLTARDILFADDSQLNQWAGIKKLHAFRDEDRKKKDRKKLSKKARLKQWRKETFGKVDEPTGGFERVLGGASGANAVEVEGGDGNVKDGVRKRKRKGKKAQSAEA